jgi:hypothetical protein
MKQLFHTFCFRFCHVDQLLVGEYEYPSLVVFGKPGHRRILFIRFRFFFEKLSYIRSVLQCD